MIRLTKNDRLMLHSLEDGAFAMALHALECGANPDSRNESGDHALHLAAKRSHLGMVAALVGAGADREARNALGMSAMDIAMRGKARAVARALTVY